ncbi:MAG: Fis family transcriptional regulator [Deltaproteobacteria bacterium]|nr:Fis family transcriptional regulator [Deltaproteobacteria bacterium]
MRLEGIEQVALAAAAARSPERVLARVVEGLVDDAGFALARIWLTGLGDICDACPMRAECPDQTICLHLAASAGNPRSAATDASSYLEDEFRRVPLGVREIGRIAATGDPLRIADIARADAWIARPAWVRSEGIRSFAGHALTFRDEVMGVLAVFAREAIDARVFESLRAFAAQVAVATANARAFDEGVKCREQVELERDYLREEVRAARAHGGLIGESIALRTVREQIELVAPTDANVLILGEPGTGKELVAQAIHEHSGRAQAALVRVNCAELPRDRFEGEFFGHERGAVPGALRDHAGRLELANGGTLFLDEIGAIPLELQGKLLRVLQQGSFERVGDDRTRHVDARVVAATNRDLRGEVDAGRFREDLYYRLAVCPIEVPPLRHRRDDIGRLAAAFLASAVRRLGKPGLRLAAADVRALERRDWPGNVRELRSVVERAAILARGTRLDLDAALPPPSGRDGARATAVAAATAIETEADRKRRERANIEAALSASRGRIYGPGGAAQLLGMKPTTLASRIKALGIGKRG